MDLIDACMRVDEVYDDAVSANVTDQQSEATETDEFDEDFIDLEVIY